MKSFMLKHTNPVISPLFSQINRERCESPVGFAHALDSWSRPEWFEAIAGELGEAANFGKKLNRIRDGVPGNDEHESEAFLKEAYAKELADAFIYLDLLAQSQGIDLNTAVIDKFNETSAKLGKINETKSDQERRS